MPGPRNQKKKKQPQKKKLQAARQSLNDDTLPMPPPTEPLSPSPNLAAPIVYLPPATEDQLGSQGPGHSEISAQDTQYSEPVAVYSHHPQYPPEHVDEPPIPPLLLKTPFLYDPGDGLRVKDARAFLASRFASPPSLDDPLCAEFAEEAVLQMLCTVLPEETAMILWYNKSRQNARICPACQRLYRLGDVLPDHLADEQTREQTEPHTSPYRAKEQELSGLCSPICFILAAYNYPGAIRSTWGRTAEELDDETWDLLDGPGQHTNDMGLGMLLKMTRCHDLGLGQLFFPDLDLDSDATCNEPESEREGEGAKGKWVDERAVDGEEDITVKMQKFGLGVYNNVTAC